MARGRMIDKVIILSKKINAVSEGAENLYYRLYVNTDDFGRFHADPKIIKGQIYTLRDISISTIENRLNELVNVRGGDKKKDCGLIEIYENGGELYLEIIDFEGHQTFRKDYVKKHEYPMCGTKSNEVERSRTKSPTKLNKIKLNKIKLNKEKAKKIIEIEFEEFWKFYYQMGNKEDDPGDKQDAKKAYNILRVKVSKSKIIKASNGYSEFLKHKELKEGFSQKKMYGSTFLRSKRWERFLTFKFTPSL